MIIFIVISGYSQNRQEDFPSSSLRKLNTLLSSVPWVTMPNNVAALTDSIRASEDNNKILIVPWNLLLQTNLVINYEGETIEELGLYGRFKVAERTYLIASFYYLFGWHRILLFDISDTALMYPAYIVISDDEYGYAFRYENDELQVKYLLRKLMSRKTQTLAILCHYIYDLKIGIATCKSMPPDILEPQSVYRIFDQNGYRSPTPRVYNDYEMQNK